MNKEFPGDVQTDDAVTQPATPSSHDVLSPMVMGQSSQVKKYKITIGGESYFLVSDEPEERVRTVARLVDSQMRAIAQAGHSDDPKRVAVLVALQCASKMLANTELIEKCQAYNDKLLGLIAQEMTTFYAASDQPL